MGMVKVGVMLVRLPLLQDRGGSWQVGSRGAGRLVIPRVVTQESGGSAGSAGARAAAAPPAASAAVTHSLRVGSKVPGEGG